MLRFILRCILTDRITVFDVIFLVVMINNIELGNWLVLFLIIAAWLLANLLVDMLVNIEDPFE